MKITSCESLGRFIYVVLARDRNRDIAFTLPCLWTVKQPEHDIVITFERQEWKINGRCMVWGC